jgi:CHAD domain-containing protein
VRVAVKKLRYALELGQETRAFRWGTAVRSLKTLQDGLGQLQDHEALLDRIREIQTPLGRTPTLTALDRLARFVEETTRQFHAGFLTRQGRLRALCAAVRRQASQAIPAGRPLAPRLTEGPSVARRERR